MGNEIIYALCFYVTAAVALASGFMVIWHKNPVINALYLVLCFFAVAVIYVLLQAHFIAVIQVLLYAGAVLVLFLMIIMLMNLSEQELARSRPTLGKAVGLAAVFGFTLMVVTVVNSLQLKAESVATKEEVAAFLVSMGTKPSELKVKAPRALTEKEKLLVAKSVLLTLGEEEAKRWVTWPANLASLTPDKQEELRRKLLTAVEGLNRLEELQSPIGFSEYKSEDMVLFIVAAAQGRLRQFSEYGTTAGVGRLLFARYLLPFEAASLLLLGAIMGVFVLSRRGLKGEN